MDRYKFTNKKRNNARKQVYKSTLYPQIKISDKDIFITSKKGQRLDNLAFKYYKDASLWWIIAQANNIRDGKFTLEGGLQIRIPKEFDTILKDLETINK